MGLLLNKARICDGRAHAGPLTHCGRAPLQNYYYLLFQVKAVGDSRNMINYGEIYRHGQKKLGVEGGIREWILSF